MTCWQQCKLTSMLLLKLHHTCLTLCAVPVMRAVMSSPSKYLSVGRSDPASLVRVGSISRLEVRALDTVPAWKCRHHKETASSSSSRIHFFLKTSLCFFKNSLLVGQITCSANFLASEFIRESKINTQTVSVRWQRKLDLYSCCPVHSMKAYGGIEVQLHVFWTSALYGGEW